MKDANTYLIFDGNCREAMTFYQKCLGAELSLMRFGDGPGNPSPEAKDRIMHARLTKGTAVLMASDSLPGMPVHQGDNFFVSIGCDSVQEIEQLFAALSDKGKIKMPLEETFWAARFAMLTDQFGINWMLNLEKPGGPGA